MRIRVELFGIPRQRAGVAQVELTWDDEPSSANDSPPTLRRVLDELARRFPPLAASCFEPAEENRSWRLSPHTLAQIQDVFTRDPDAPLADDDRVLLLSADAGG